MSTSKVATIFFLLVSVLTLQNNFVSAASSKFFGPRIINGERAVKGQFPWQAVIQITHSYTTWCGGALISDRWILTAGHCVQSALSFTIALGSTKLIGADSDRIVLESNQYILHEEYNYFTLANDIALIALPKAVSFNENVRPIRLPSTELSAGTPVTVSGWGITSDGSDEPSIHLNYVNLTTTTNDDCRQIYGFLNPGVVCAKGNPNMAQGTCEGDSGGPLISAVSGGPLLVGVVSYGHRDGCEQGAPVGFTRTYFFREWIKNNTGV